MTKVGGCTRKKKTATHTALGEMNENVSTQPNVKLFSESFESKMFFLRRTKNAKKN